MAWLVVRKRLVRARRVRLFRPYRAVYFLDGMGVDGVVDRHKRICAVARGNLLIALRLAKKRGVCLRAVAAFDHQRFHVVRAP